MLAVSDRQHADLPGRARRGAASAPRRSRSTSSRRSGACSRRRRARAPAPAGPRRRRRQRQRHDRPCEHDRRSCPRESGRDGRERAQPGGAGERRARVDPADVVDLRHAPAQPQRPAARPAPREAEEHVEHGLLADEHGRREVHEHERRQARQGAPVGDPPVARGGIRAARRSPARQARQPVVGDQPRALGRAPRRDRDGPGG